MDSDALYVVYLVSAVFWSIVGALAFKSKGYSAWAGLASGFFLGLFSLLMLSIMEGQKKKQAAAQQFAYPPQPGYPATQPYAAQFPGYPPQAAAYPASGGAASFSTGQRLVRAAIVAGLIVVINYIESTTYSQVFNLLGTYISIWASMINAIFTLVVWTVAGAGAAYPDWRAPTLARATMAGLVVAAASFITTPLWMAMAGDFGFAAGSLLNLVLGMVVYLPALLVLDAGKINAARLALLGISLMISVMIQYLIYTNGAGSVSVWVQGSTVITSALFALAVCWAPFPALGERRAAVWNP